MCLGPAPTEPASESGRYKTDQLKQKRKCGNLVAARRGFTWMWPDAIIAKFGLRSREKQEPARKAGATSIDGGQPEMAVPPVPLVDLD